MLFTVIVFRSPSLGLRLDLLYPFKRRSVDDRLVDILEDHPVFLIVRDPPFVSEVLGVGLEVYEVAAILLISEDLTYRYALPKARIFRHLVTTTFYSSVVPIRCRVQDFSL